MFDLTINTWKEQRVCLRPPAEDDEILSVLNDCGFQPTADVLNLYRRLDGFMDGEYCRNHLSLWSLAKIRQENEFNPTPDVWIADYLIDSYYYSLRRQDSQTSSVYVQFFDDDQLVNSFKVADTLDVFFERLVSDPASIHAFPLSDVKRKSSVFQWLTRLWKSPS